MNVLLKSFVTDKMREIAKPEVVDLAGDGSGVDSGEVSDRGFSGHKKKKKKEKKEKKSKKSKKSHKRKSRSPSSDSDSDFDRPHSDTRKSHSSKKSKYSKPEKKSNFYEDYEKVKEILDEYEPGEEKSPEQIKRETESFNKYKREDTDSKYYKEESLSYRPDSRRKDSSRNNDRYSTNDNYSQRGHRSNYSSRYGYTNDPDDRSSSRYSDRKRSNSRSRYRRSTSRDRDRDEKREIRTYILPQFNVNSFGQSSDIKAGKTGTTTKTVEFNKPRVEQSVADFVKQCRAIAKDGDEEEEEPLNKPYVSDEDDDSPSTASRKKKPGFTVKPANILLNIPNCTQMSLPVYKGASQLRLEYPVGSGEDHREHNENIAKGKLKEEDPQADRVFDEVPTEKPDIGRAMKDKAMLTKLLDQNAYDTASLIKLHKVEKIIHQWSLCNKEPGKFTGHTKVQCLTQRELGGDDPYNETWAKKDIFRKAKKLTAESAGMGQVLLQKMGWSPGQPLGKNKQGLTEPIDLNFNLDRKGLCGEGESIGNGPVYGALSGLEGRNPISVLADTCRKKGWGNPYYEQVSETGPPHKRIFHFKVRVDNVDYIPHSGSASKKQAKADAAAGALFALGLS